MICAAGRAAIADAACRADSPARSPLEEWEIIQAARANGTKFDGRH
jgi:hypothetical protein